MKVPEFDRRFSRRSLLRGTLGAALNGATPTTFTLARAQGTMESTESLWNRTIREYLLGSRWIDKLAYSAGHVLMVPLHAAFTIAPDDTWRADFADHVSRFVKHSGSGPLPTNRITRQQYLYLWSQFAILAHRSGTPELIPPRLIELLTDEQHRLWLTEPAWQWDRAPFSGGMRERVEWKLTTRTVDVSYHRAIVDEEHYCFAIAADLVELSSMRDEAPPAAAASAVQLADQVYRREGIFTPTGGWLFQPGVWTEHPDYAYAGTEKISKDMAQSPVPGIAPDTSHSHRMSRWLQSLAAVPGSLNRDAMYSGILGGLERQFFETVLVRPTTDFAGYRTTNFMDGHNGVYRWDYPALGKNNGYGPFELSGTLCYGWWAFLGTPRSRDLYRGISETFPLAGEVVETYVGPYISDLPSPSTNQPTFYTSGLPELMTRLAGDLRV